MNIRPTLLVTEPRVRASFLTILQLWWWPTFVFLSPLLVTSVGQQDRNDLIVAKYILGLLALIGGILLEWSYRTPSKNSPLYGLERPPLFNSRILPVVLFGVWAVLSSFWAPEPIFALLGVSFHLADASIWTLTITLCSWLIYLSCQRNPELVRLICFAAAGAGAVLGGLAALEVILGHALYYPISRVDIPQVNFPQRGHLAGFLALCLGVALASARWKYWPMVVCALLCALGVGVSFNRASVAAVAFAVIICVFIQWRKFLLPGMLAFLCIGLGWWMGQTFNVQGTRELATSQTVATRSYMWRAGLVGIGERPLTGWGGNAFVNVWTDKISFNDLKTYLKLEFGDTLIKRIPKTNILRVKRADGSPSQGAFIIWKSHNQFIEIALLYGLPGLALYLWILISLLRRKFLSNPAAIGVITYHVFFMLWFAIPESDGVLWALIGAGMAGLPSTRAPETSTLEPSPPNLSST